MIIDILWEYIYIYFLRIYIFLIFDTSIKFPVALVERNRYFTFFYCECIWQISLFTTGRCAKILCKFTEVCVWHYSTYISVRIFSGFLSEITQLLICGDSSLEWRALSVHVKPWYYIYLFYFFFWIMLKALNWIILESTVLP